MNLDLDALQRAAEAATPGPWVRTAGYRVECHELLDVKHSGHGATWSGGTKVVLVAETWNGHLPGINAEFLALANPAAVLEMVRRLKAAEAALADRPTDANAVGLAEAFAIATAGPQASDATLKARAEGRAEAVQIIIGLSAEDGLDDCIGSHQVGMDGEWDAYWKDDKLRALFRVDDAAWSLIQETEGQMIDAQCRLSEIAMDAAFNDDRPTAEKAGGHGCL